MSSSDEDEGFLGFGAAGDDDSLSEEEEEEEEDAAPTTSRLTPHTTPTAEADPTVSLPDPLEPLPKRQKGGSSADGSSTHVLRSPSQYLRIQMNLIGTANKGFLTEQGLEQAIIMGLRELFGQLGGAAIVHIISLESETSTAILRVASRDMVKLWSVLTSMTEFGGAQCHIRVVKASPFLMHLAHR